MLRGIDPILSPDLLQILRAMGHGDDIVIADANFPAEAMASRLVRLDGIDAPCVLQAVLSVMPLDNFVDDPAITMQIVGESESIPPVVERFQMVIDAVADNVAKIVAVERFDFYARARQAFAVVQTGERRLYGNIILKKGVVSPTDG
ncbi:L-fucose mutarotase [Pseudaminobacter salicylatoxidans]|uniref:L-fucose mutarotase n=1 Tax=Pseudaminobacter salicylatoxidans TaxID=93369 RepID=A0A316C3G6_PSESE|nr:RbsD/FucU domain-containing protein [Pseudaminobacter salicylatoxidans]PWJ82351.1 L-fucose mutarotase [Pseudaminobacter salicylatoxidans]